jgi:hypothetical protein
LAKGSQDASNNSADSPTEPDDLQILMKRWKPR